MRTQPKNRKPSNPMTEFESRYGDISMALDMLSAICSRHNAHFVASVAANSNLRGHLVGVVRTNVSQQSLYDKLALQVISRSFAMPSNGVHTTPPRKASKPARRRRRRRNKAAR